MKENKQSINYDEIFNYVLKRTELDPVFYDTIKNSYLRSARKNNFLVKLLVQVISKTFTTKRKHIKYFFYGFKFKDLILSLPKNEVCVLGGPRQLLFCLKYRVPFLSVISLSKLLYQCMLKGKNKENINNVISEIKKISLIFKSTYSEPFFIVENDSLPVQRVLINAAKRAYMKTICIQHGVFQKKAPPCITDGRLADYFFCFDNYQKELLINKGIPSKKITTMGFHSETYFPNNKKKKNRSRQKICFLGQPWGKYRKESFDYYWDVFQRVVSICDKNGLSVDFKPHPGELKSSYLSQIKRVKPMSMPKAIEKYDVFVSLTSTALLEAVDSGKIAIQIRDDFFDSDDFSCFSNVVSVEYNSDSFDKDFYRNIVNSNYPNQKKEAGIKERFLNSLINVL